MNIIFFGTAEFAVPSLQALVAAGYNIVGVITAPDKPAGRGQKLQPSAVKIAALELGLNVLQPEKLKAPEFIAALQALQPDLGIVIAFRMLPEAVWAMPRLGTFNLHAALLPQYRGAAPINWAIINGETETGVTTFFLNSEIDKGAIIGQRRVPIAPQETFGELYGRLMLTGRELVLDTVEKIDNGQLTPDNAIAQQEKVVLHPAPKIFKEDCRINWNWNGKRIVDFVRGLSPYPTAWSEMQQNNTDPITVKIFAVLFESAEHRKPAGEIESDGRNFIRVACPDGWITLADLQLAGKRRMAVRDLLLGLRDVARYRFE